MPSDYIEAYQNLVYKMAGKFYGADREDLIQAGFLGLAKAYKNFKPDCMSKFSTYAYEYIYGEMYETVNGNRPIKMKKDALRLYKNVVKTKDLLSQKYDREVTYKEVADFLQIDMTVLYDIMNSLNSFVSIENTELNLTRQDHIDVLILLKQSLTSLSPLEKSVIEERYMSDLSQDETAKKLGLSQVKVSRIERQGKEKIKTFVAS